jgi:hypothetical protein
MDEPSPLFPKSVENTLPFIQFRNSLSPEDQQVLDNLLEAASQHHAAVDYSGHPFPTLVYLLTLLVEHHKARQRLEREVDELERKRRGLGF